MITNNLVPMVITNEGKQERAMDIYSCLLKERIIMLQGDVDKTMASLITSQLLFLESQGDAPISLYINSNGGSVYDGLNIHSVMRYIKPPVHTICCGMAASMGAFLLSAGDKRYALPDSTIMIHQVLSSTGTKQATDIEIHMRETMRLKEKLTKYLAEYCKKSYQEVYDACERDNYMSAEMALEFNLIDEIIATRKEIPPVV